MQERGHKAAAEAEAGAAVRGFAAVDVVVIVVVEHRQRRFVDKGPHVDQRA